MKVLVIHNAYRSDFPSGENIAVDREVALLRSSNISVARYQVSSDDIEFFTKRQFLAMAMNLVGTRLNTSLEEIIQVDRPDVVHLHNPVPMLGLGLIAAIRALGLPVAQTLHNYRLGCIGGLLFRNGKVCQSCTSNNMGIPGVLHRCYRDSQSQSALMAAATLANRKSLRAADVYFALTPFMRDMYVNWGIEASKIVIKPSWAFPDERPTGVPMSGQLLFVGRLEESKGVKLLVDAWKSRSTKSHFTRLTIAGSGPLEESLAREVDPSIALMGRVSEEKVQELLRQSDALALPSQWFEGLPLTYVEAMAHQRPVVLNVGTSTASMAPYSSSWHLQSDSSSWRKFLDEVGPDEIRSKAAAAGSNYLELYSPKRSLEILHTEYSRIIKGR